MTLQSVNVLMTGYQFSIEPDMFVPPALEDPELKKFAKVFRNCPNLTSYSDEEMDSFAALILHGDLHMHLNDNQLIRASLAIQSQIQLRQAKRLDAANSSLQKRVLLLTYVAVVVGIVQIAVAIISLYK